jgi:hypothetical protein
VLCPTTGTSTCCKVFDPTPDPSFIYPHPITLSIVPSLSSTWASLKFSFNKGTFLTGFFNTITAASLNKPLFPGTLWIDLIAELVNDIAKLSLAVNLYLLILICSGINKLPPLSETQCAAVRIAVGLIKDPPQ